MRPGQHSRTAQAAAAFRASHTLYDRPVVFDDPYALRMTSPGWQRILGSRLLHGLVMRGLLRRMAPVVAQVVGRSRYAEDRLQQAIERGVNQYVIVGAGLDAFALRRRDLAQRLRVFEVDHPDTQRAKRAQLAAIEPQLPGNLEFVACDFEREDIAQALSRSGYRADMPGFYSWLGTTHYLRPEATLATLRAIAAFAALGSEVVLDYSLTAALMPAELREAAQRMRRMTARQGEPMIGGLDPRELHAAVRAMGYGIVDDSSGAQQAQRYFADRSDGLAPTPASHLLHLRLGR